MLGSNEEYIIQKRSLSTDKRQRISVDAPSFILYERHRIIGGCLFIVYSSDIFINDIKDPYNQDMANIF